MAKVKVHELAKELNIQSKEILQYLSEQNIEVKSHMSSIEDDVIRVVKKKFAKSEPVKEEKAAPKAAEKEEDAHQERPKKKSSITAVYNPQNSKQPNNRRNNGQHNNQNGNRGARPQGGARPARPQGVRCVHRGNARREKDRYVHREIVRSAHSRQTDRVRGDLEMRKIIARIRTAVRIINRMPIITKTIEVTTESVRIARKNLVRD